MEKNKTEDRNIRYTYFHDPMTPRTVTVARMLIEDKMYLAWSVNKMNKSTVAHAKDNYEPQWYGDIFTKKIGRKVASGRLFLCDNPIVINPDIPKIRHVVAYMMASSPKFVQEIIVRSIKEKYPDSAL